MCMMACKADVFSKISIWSQQHSIISSWLGCGGQIEASEISEECQVFMSTSPMWLESSSQSWTQKVNFFTMSSCLNDSTTSTSIILRILLLANWHLWDVKASWSADVLQTICSLWSLEYKAWMLYRIGRAIALARNLADCYNFKSTKRCGFSRPLLRRRPLWWCERSSDCQRLWSWHLPQSPLSQHPEWLLPLALCVVLQSADQATGAPCLVSSICVAPRWSSIISLLNYHDLRAK